MLNAEEQEIKDKQRIKITAVLKDQEMSSKKSRMTTKSGAQQQEKLNKLHGKNNREVVQLL